MFEKWRSFRCYKCGRKASGPLTETSSYVFSSTPEGDNIHTDYIKNNKLPGDLYQCSNCHNWFCNTHITGGGLCEKCYEENERRRAAAVPEWQRRIAADNARQAAEEKAAAERREREARERKEAEQNARMTSYKARYACAICGMHTEGPPLEYVHDLITQMWNKEPKDLQHCRICGRLVCFKSSCSYSGVCKECGKRL